MSDDRRTQLNARADNVYIDDLVVTNEKLVGHTKWTDSIKMGSRLKDIVYISIIVFLGVGIYTSYTRDGSTFNPTEEWNNWSERGQVVDLDENLLQIDDGVDGTELEQLTGEHLDQEGDQQPFDIHATFDGQELKPDEEAILIGQRDDIVHGESHMAEDPLAGFVEDFGNHQNLLLEQQAQLNSPADSQDSSLVAAAGQIIQNHANQDQSLGPQDPSNPALPPSTIGDLQPPTGEKAKPKLIFRSRSSRDIPSDDSSVPKIPRIIHQSWETTDIPMNFAKWVASWLEKNPGWEYWFWTPADVEALLEQSYPSYTSTLAPGISLENRANVMRYFIIHAHGGVYAELDMECLNSIDTWIFSHGCFLAEEAREHSYLVHNILTGSVINAIMACRPHHPFYEVILHALPDYLQRYPSEPRRASGSLFLDEIFRAFKKHPLPPSLVHYGDVALIEPDYFIPSYDQKHWSSIDKSCNTNIASMPFHVSWLCTLWIRKRMHENQPYEHSYTDHHWLDPSEIGQGNIVTIPISTIIKSVIAGGGIPGVEESDSASGSASSAATGVQQPVASLGGAPNIAPTQAQLPTASLQQQPILPPIQSQGLFQGDPQQLAQAVNPPPPPPQQLPQLQQQQPQQLPQQLPQQVPALDLSQNQFPSAVLPSNPAPPPGPLVHDAYQVFQQPAQQQAQFVGNPLANNVPLQQPLGAIPPAPEQLPLGNVPPQ